MSVRVLDCTLRDGGYYNSWRFSDDLVADYLSAVSRAGVDFVEIGFRNFPQPSFVGPYAYSTDAFLETLPIPDDLNIGVMIDAKTVLTTPDGPVSAVDKLFSHRDQSRASLVRIAAHFDEVVHFGPVVERFKSLGYLVGLNIMQMAGRESALVSEVAGTVESWGTVDMLYFADSLGSMDAVEVDRIKGKKITVVPILRAGLGMMDGVLDLIPSARVSVVGLYRNEETLEPVAYFQKFTRQIEDRTAMILDPMLATGGSLIATIDMLKEAGCKRIKGLFLVAAPEGIANLQEKHPDVDIYVASVDEKLNEVGYIIPGLGDAGDKIFGTK